MLLAAVGLRRMTRQSVDVSLGTSASEYLVSGLGRPLPNAIEPAPIKT